MKGASSQEPGPQAQEEQEHERSVGGLRQVAAAFVLSMGLLGAGLLPFMHEIREFTLIGSAAVAALIPAVDARFRRRADLLEPGVLIGFAYLVLFPIRALVVLLDLDPLENPRVDAASFDDVRRTLIVSAVGILIGSIAYVSPLGALLGSRVRIPQAQVAESPGIVLPVIIFGVGLVAQVTILVGERVESVSTILAGRTSGIISGTSVMLLLGLALLARLAARSRDETAWIALGVAVGLGLAASVAGQFKEVAVLSLATPLIVLVLTAQARVGPRRLAFAGMVLLVMFVAITVWRHASARVDTANPIEVGAAFPEQVVQYDWRTGGERPLRPWTPLSESASLVSHRLYGYDSLALAVIYTPSEIPYQHGATLENLAAGLVPRIVWPSKPGIGIGYWFAQSYWGTPPGVLEVPQSVTHLGELWIDFGWIGVLGMAILGIWYRFVYAALRPRASGTGAILYVIVLLTILPVDRDLPLVYVTLVQRLAFVAILLGAAALFERALERRCSA